jgi:hypothetical protein
MNQLMSDISTHHGSLNQDSIEGIVNAFRNENDPRSLQEMIEDVEDRNITHTPPESDVEEDESDERAQLLLNDINRDRAIKRFDPLNIQKKSWKKLIKFIGGAAVGGGITSTLLQPYINALPKQEGSTIKINPQDPPTVSEPSGPKYSDPDYTISQLTGDVPPVDKPAGPKYSSPDYTISQLTGDEPPASGYADEIRPPSPPPIRVPLPSTHLPNPTMKKPILGQHAPRVVNYKKPITPANMIPPSGPSVSLPISPTESLNDIPIQPNGQIPQANKFGPYKIGRLNKNYFTTKHNDLQWSQYVLGSIIKNMSLR